MVLYKKEWNLILVEPVKTKMCGAICWAYNKLMQCLHDRGIKVVKHILDNEASVEFLNTICWNGIEYEKVQPHMYWQNMAEKAIITFKDRFQVMMAGIDNMFPMHLWYHLLTQAESMLNMMPPTDITPTISAYKYIYGQHLQQNAFSIHVVCSTAAKQTWYQKNMRCSHNQWILYQNIPGALQMLWSMGKRHKKCMHYWHSILQA